jgi:hypothetical protein
MRGTTRRGRPPSAGLLPGRSDKIAALAIILALLSAVYAIFISRKVYLESLPEIRLASPESSPDAVHFMIMNKSRFVTVRKLQWLCEVDYTAELRLGAAVSEPVAEGMGPKVTLPPSSSTSASCAIGKPESLGPRVVLLVRYEFLWFRAAFQSARFKWSAHADPPRWIEDELASESVPPRE